MRKLVLRGHNINAQDNVGDTPLHFACFYGHRDIVTTMILAGADTKITNDKGETPAHVAERRKHNELLHLLDRDNLWQMMLNGKFS